MSEGAGPQPMTEERREREATAARERATATVRPVRPPTPKKTVKVAGRKIGTREEVSYADAVKGLLSIPAAALLIVGQRSKSIPLLADSVAITVHGELIAQACEDTAEADPRFAAILERVTAFGPYGALFAATLPLVAQVAANHGAPVAVLGALGATEPEKFLTANGIPVGEPPSPNGERGNQS